MITKIALNALKMRAPFLSEAALKKVQDAGMIKSVQDLIPGWQEGSRNLAKKYNVDMDVLPKEHPKLNKALQITGGGAVFAPTREDVYTQLSNHVPSLYKAMIPGLDDTIEKAVAKLPANTAMIAHNPNVSGNAGRDLLRNVLTRHELSEAKFGKQLTDFMEKATPILRKDNPFSFSKITQDDVEALKQLKYRRKPHIWQKVTKHVSTNAAPAGHNSSHVLRDERRFLMESGHPELVGKYNPLSPGGGRNLSGEADAFKKITGNEGMNGSLARDFDASKYVDMTNGALRKQLKQDDTSLRRYINREERGTGLDFLKEVPRVNKKTGKQYINKKTGEPVMIKTQRDPYYLLPSEPGLMKTKVLPFVNEKVAPVVKDKVLPWVDKAVSKIKNRGTVQS